MLIPISWSSFEVATMSYSGSLSIDPKITKLVFTIQAAQLLICFFAILLIFYKKIELGILKSTALMIAFTLILIISVLLINYFFIDIIKVLNLEPPRYAGWFLKKLFDGNDLYFGKILAMAFLFSITGFRAILKNDYFFVSALFYNLSLYHSSGNIR